MNQTDFNSIIETALQAIEGLDGITPLHLARVETAPLLLDAGADLEARANDGTTPLITLSAERDSLEVMTLLIERGADVKARDNAGRSALDIARSRGELAKIALLEGRSGRSA